MKLIETNKNKIILELSRYDLGTLSNTLNEVCNGIEVLDFENRIGISTEEAENMLEFLSSTYLTIRKNEKFED